jgi:CHASE2 domain-containing sensor protein
MGAEVTRHPEERLNQRWLNYFGPSQTLTTVSFHQALYDNGVPPDFFRDKIVFIGTNFAIGGPGVRRDQFANPYSRWGLLFSPGLELHATEFLNLTRGNWLRRFSPPVEIICLFFCGLSLGVIGNYLNPKLGAIVAIGFALLLSGVTIAAVYQAHAW